MESADRQVKLYQSSWEARLTWTDGSFSRIVLSVLAEPQCVRMV